MEKYIEFLPDSVLQEMFVSMLREKLVSQKQEKATTPVPVQTVPAIPQINQEELLEKLGSLIDSKVSSMAKVATTTTTKRTVMIQEEVTTPIEEEPKEDEIVDIPETGDDVVDDFLLNIMK